MNTQIRQQFLGKHSAERLRGLCAGVIGLGGGGSHIAQQLAHIGVGKFILADFDKYEDKNHNRTVGGEHGDIARAPYKVHIAERMIRRVNPAAEVLAINAEWQSALAPLRGCDVLFGGLDSFAQRDQLERLSRRYLIPYIDVGMDVHNGPAGHSIHGQVILSLPGGLCMRCFNFLRDEFLEQEARQYGTGGGRPQVVWPNGVLASSAIGLFMQMVTPWHQGVLTGSTMLDYDGNLHRISVSPRVEALRGRVCDHFDDPTDIGDPFWQCVEAGTNKPMKYHFLRRIVNTLRRTTSGFRKE